MARRFCHRWSSREAFSGTTIHRQAARRSRPTSRTRRERALREDVRSTLDSCRAMRGARRVSDGPTPDSRITKCPGEDRKRPGGFAIRIDLKKVNAEMTDLRSKLAAIDNDLDECRRRHFEHPRARSQIRRGAPLSGIVCSVASRNLPSLASAPAGDHWGLVLCCRSALSPARASGPPKGSNISSRRTRRSGPTAR